MLKRTIPGRAGLADVGARLKALRLAQGLSVNELAMRAGVSVGTVSQLERNKSNPSVRILELLRQALMVPLSALFEESAGASEIEVRDFVRKSKQRPLFEVGKSGMKKELLTPRGEHDLQMMVINLAIGSTTDEVMIGSGEKAGLVLEGTVVLSVGDRSAELSAGDSFQFKSTMPHSLRNESESIARILWIINMQPLLIHL